VTLGQVQICMTLGKSLLYSELSIGFLFCEVMLPPRDIFTCE
jgi:hypothetical protein